MKGKSVDGEARQKRRDREMMMDGPRCSNVARDGPGTLQGCPRLKTHGGAQCRPLQTHDTKGEDDIGRTRVTRFLDINQRKPVKEGREGRRVLK